MKYNIETEETLFQIDFILKVAIVLHNDVTLVKVKYGAVKLLLKVFFFSINQINIRYCFWFNKIIIQNAAV